MSLLQPQLVFTVIIYSLLQSVYMNTWIHFLCGYRETDVVSTDGISSNNGMKVAELHTSN